MSRVIVKVGCRGRGGVSDIAALKFRKYAYLCLGDSFLSGTPVAGSANENGFQGCQSLILCCIPPVTILDCIN